MCVVVEMPFQNTPEARTAFLVARMTFVQVGRNVHLQACDLIRDTGLMAVASVQIEEVMWRLFFCSFTEEADENIL